MIGILSDIHGNSKALLKTLSILKREGAQAIYCLGDVLGYIPTVDAVQILRSSHELAICLQGNHEDMIFSNFNDAEKMKIYKTSEIRQSLSDEDANFLKQARSSHVKQFPCGEVLFVHGSPSDTLNGYIYPDTKLDPWQEISADFVFMGHTHRPFIREAHSKIFVNVGSCGMPRDTGEFGSACLFNEKTGQVRIIRFSIKDETSEMLNHINDVHPSVVNLFERRTEGCFGEFIDE